MLAIPRKFQVCQDNVPYVELRLPMLCNSPVLDYLNMRDEGGLVKGLVKVEIACLGQDKR